MYAFILSQDKNICFATDAASVHTSRVLLALFQRVFCFNEFRLLRPAYYVFVP